MPLTFSCAQCSARAGSISELGEHECPNPSPAGLKVRSEFVPQAVAQGNRQRYITHCERCSRIHDREEPCL